MNGAAVRAGGFDVVTGDGTAKDMACAHRVAAGWILFGRGVGPEASAGVLTVLVGPEARRSARTRAPAGGELVAAGSSHRETNEGDDGVSGPRCEGHAVAGSAPCGGGGTRGTGVPRAHDETTSPARGAPAPEGVPRGEDPTAGHGPPRRERNPDRARRSAAPVRAVELSARTGEPGGHTAVREGIAVMRERLAEALTLADIAAEVNVSVFHFVRLFRSATGTTPHRFLTGLRMELARHLLSETSLTVAQIAARCGFAGAGSFSQAFLRHAGVRPSAYRVRRRGRNPGAAGQFEEEGVRDASGVVDFPGHHTEGGRLRENRPPRSPGAPCADPVAGAPAALRPEVEPAPGPYPEERDRHAAVREGIALMRERLAEELPLADIAAEVNVSVFHFLRLFRSATGTTPQRYLTGLRIELARRLLSETTLTVAQIAARCGFAGSSSFSQAFLHHAGVRPSVYRGIFGPPQGGEDPTREPRSDLSPTSEHS